MYGSVLDEVACCIWKSGRSGKARRTSLFFRGNIDNKM